MSAAEDRPTPIERSGRSPAMSALDEGILVRLHDAIALERSLEVQLSQARDATRSLIRNGQDRLASKTSSTLTWLALESATGLTQSGLRSRATLGTGTGSEEARRLAHRSAAEARLTVNHPDRFAPATVTAAARLTGTPVSTTVAMPRSTLTVLSQLRQAGGRSWCARTQPPQRPVPGQTDVDRPGTSPPWTTRSSWPPAQKSSVSAPCTRWVASAPSSYTVPVRVDGEHLDRRHQPLARAHRVAGGARRGVPDRRPPAMASTTSSTRWSAPP